MFDADNDGDLISTTNGHVIDNVNCTAQSDLRPEGPVSREPAALDQARQGFATSPRCRSDPAGAASAAAGRRGISTTTAISTSSYVAERARGLAEESGVRGGTDRARAKARRATRSVRATVTVDDGRPPGQGDQQHRQLRQQQRHSPACRPGRAKVIRQIEILCRAVLDKS
jgi:hypothetical protein